MNTPAKRRPATAATAPAPAPAPATARIAALKIAGVGRVCLWQGGSLWIGRQAGHSLPHAHHGIQISLSLDGPAGKLLFKSGAGSAWSAYRAAIVMPNRLHEFDGLGGAVAQIFVEPETTQGRILIDRYAAADITALPSELTDNAADLLGRLLREHRHNQALVAASQRMVDALAGPLPARPAVHPRIAAAIDFITRRMNAGIALGEVAAAVHLSPSRLRHLFVQETGTTFRGYVLWLRITRAVAVMMDGRTWTDAAHATGFADSAHLSRTFRRMFGISPAMLLREKR
jgi:AraC-like DNA-binding protein